MNTPNNQRHMSSNNDARKNQPLINDQIRFRTMVVIDDHGNNLGEIGRASCRERV